ncbi:hypothetical protein M7I_4552 [Glarea lozoyensis 74030]|uniref:Uncharacterized protein n=1 Tax=Glarea lozoyensis (strain ATCC 74030 / MF5533) TaxID=1104152 RepID=H0EPH3_GLAL7|nr:hypothetical protein M7I_4552 [Glarea lozoyensis 74030]
MLVEAGVLKRRFSNFVTQDDMEDVPCYEKIMRHNDWEHFRNLEN